MRLIMRRLTLFLSAFVLGVTLFASPEVIAAPQTDQDAATYDYVFYDEKIYGFPENCSAGTPVGIGVGATTKVPVNFSLGTGAAQRQVSLIKALMADYGFTAAQAAGVIGNFMVESGGEDIPPNVNQGGHRGPPAFSGGYGWAQWTGSRQRTFIDYAVKNGYMSSSGVSATDAANYAYLKSELNTGYKSTVTDLKKQTSPENAALSWERTFEKAGVPALGRRSADARTAYNNYVASGTTGNEGGAEAPDPTNAACDSTGNGDPAIVGNYAFPLLGTKRVVTNPGMFHNGTADRGGHPYIAFDILANPGTQVVAFMGGVVTHIGTDRCPGRLISVYNKESNLVISYLHMNTDEKTYVAQGTTLTPGAKVGLVGPKANGCGIAHLHIDAAAGQSRPGCSRLNCPVANSSKFRDIGPQLYQTFQKLPN